MKCLYSSRQIKARPYTQASTSFDSPGQINLLSYYSISMTISNFFTQKNHLKIAHLLSLRNFFVTQTYFAGPCEKIKGKNYPFLHSPDGAVKCFMQPIKKEEIPWTRENCDSSGYVQTMFPQLPSRRGPRPRPKDYPTHPHQCTETL